MAKPTTWNFGEKQAWIRFFVGLAGLALSFFAALSSTALRTGGNSGLSAAAASFALLCAGAVGLYTVPYLAKRVVRESWTEAFDYEVTREGVVYLASVLIISIAALNTGNNLLFIIISAMLAAIIVSGVASALTLRRLRLEMSLPEEVFARQQVVARLRLNNRRRLPVFSIQVSSAETSKGKFKWQRTTFQFPPKREKGDAWFAMNDWHLRRAHATGPRQTPSIDAVYFPYITGRSSVNADVALSFPKRGLYQQRALGVSTRFPFSFVKKTRKISLDREVLVFPDVSRAQQLLSALPTLAGEFESPLRGHGHDLYRIRDLVAGDAARSVDWKATARSGGLMVREFTRDDDRRVRIIFDNPPLATLAEPEYEQMVAAGASLAWELSQRQIPLEFIAPEHHSTDVIDFLEYLALVAPNREPGHVPELADDAFTIVLTAADWPTAGDRFFVLRYAPAPMV
jgi:uncharacterized protein (DUF58 family)